MMEMKKSDERVSLRLFEDEEEYNCENVSLIC